MSTFIIIYGLVILLGVCLVGGGIVLLVKNYPDRINSSQNFRKTTQRRTSPIKKTNEHIQEILKDFEEKWRNPQ